MLSYRQQNPTCRYRIGTNKDPWVQTQAREVHFAELPAGTVQFEVQGEAEPGVWSRPAFLELWIRAPWFLSWPCRVSLLFLLGGVIWFWWRRREAGQGKVRAELKVAVEERTRDVTAARARAEQASRVKSEFVANISHEMRTPLNTVIGFTHLALQMAAQPDVVEYLNNVHLSAKGLLDLINDVLDFSKMEAGKLAITPVAFALRPFVSDITSILWTGSIAEKARIEQCRGGFRARMDFCRPGPPPASACQPAGQRHQIHFAGSRDFAGFPRGQPTEGCGIGHGHWHSSRKAEHHLRGFPAGGQLHVEAVRRHGYTIDHLKETGGIHGWTAPARERTEQREHVLVHQRSPAGFGPASECAALGGITPPRPRANPRGLRQSGEPAPDPCSAPEAGPQHRGRGERRRGCGGNRSGLFRFGPHGYLNAGNGRVGGCAPHPLNRINDRSAPPGCGHDVTGYGR